jgi:hypothetical protein
MGGKLTAKYKGQCQFCGSEWKVGEEILYQKNPKAICSSEECYKEQGGTISTFVQFKKDFISTPKSNFNASDPTLKMDLPTLEIPDGIKIAAETVQQAFVTSHHLAKSLYPAMDENTHTFSMIRSNLVDKILTVCALRKE